MAYHTEISFLNRCIAKTVFVYHELRTVSPFKEYAVLLYGLHCADGILIGIIHGTDGIYLGKLPRQRHGHNHGMTDDIGFSVL